MIDARPTTTFLLLLAAAVAPVPAQQSDLPTDGLRYRCVGPTRGGRVTAVEGVVGKPGEFFMGATGGGLWRSRDYGNSWQNVSDGSFRSPSIGAIAVAQSDPEVVYVGTGSDGLRSNVIVGKGVYKSTDGGDQWTFVGLEGVGLIGAVEVHPVDQDVVFVAAIGNPFASSPERGLYRSTDGGGSWQAVLQVSERTGVVDVEYCPGDPQVVYATAWQAERKPWTIVSGGEEGGVFRSLDGGTSWQKLSQGLPAGIVGKADLAVSPAAPDRVYLLIEASGDAGGVYVSDDRGSTFRQVSADRGLRLRPFYYTNIDCSPTDGDDVFVSATRFHRSRDGGKTWRTLRTTHADHHDLWIDPTDPDVWIQGNDGGAAVTRDGGLTWSSLDNQPTAELYQVAVDNRSPYWLYAGQQDNTTIRVPSAAPYRHPAGASGFWQAVGGCETGPAVPSPVDPNVVFSACKGRFAVYYTETGEEQHFDVGAANMYGHNPRDLMFRFQRVAPITISPHDPERIFHASQFLHVTTDRGRNWQQISPDLTANLPEYQVISGSPITRDITGEEIYSTIYEVAESPLQRGLLWVGSNDGLVHVSRDGGANWSNVTPAGLPPGGRVQTIEPSPHTASRAYACVLRYQLGDFRPWVFRTDDFGRSWTLLTPGDNGVPDDHPARVLREDPVRAGLLFLGTEWGMFVSGDDGSSWRSLQQNLPITPITDLVVHGSDLVLSTMGRAFWILDDLSPLRASQGVDLESAVLFEPQEAARGRHRHGFGAGDVPQDPPRGAVIDYWLPGDQQPQDVQLRIYDADGRCLRAFCGSGTERLVTAEADRMEQIEELPRAEARLGTTRGHHRISWDLRVAPTADLGRNLRSRRGPQVLTGRYRVELSVGSGEQEVRRSVGLSVSLDVSLAAVGVTEADLVAQHALQLRVQTCMQDARALVTRIDAMLADENLTGDERGRWLVMRSKLVTAGGDYPQPMLLDQLRYLEGIVAGEHRPGRDAEKRCDQLEELVRELTAAVNAR
jgi:photosystem II stability/assembly factor-like uncharacterized protein